MVNVHIIGRLGADSELVNGKNGQFLSFRLATDDRKHVEKTTSWFRVNLNGERAPKLLEYLKKGKLISVTGTETVSTYQAKDGSTQISRDINASNIEFIPIGRENADGSVTTTQEKPAEAVTTGTFKAPQASVAVATEKAPEDDLPF